jgi:hypothetical protein
MKPSDVVRPHKTVERNGVLALKLSEGEFAGIIFSYGRVAFEEDKENDRLRVKFDYEIHDFQPDDLDVPAFEKELGDFLIELCMYGVLNNDLVYTGGVDAYRKDNIIESDPQ